MKIMNISRCVLLFVVLFLFVSQTEQAGPFGKRLTVYADSACNNYLAESHVYSPGYACTPFNCSLYMGNYATVDCNADLSVYPKEETIGVALHLDACVTDYERYLVAANATGACIISAAAGLYYIVTTNDCPNRTVVDLYQFRVNGACQTLERHLDTNIGQCTYSSPYYSEAICPVAPTPVTPPVTPPVDVPIEAPVTVIAPQTAPVTPISEPVDASQPLDAPVTAPVTSSQPLDAPVTGPVNDPKPRLSFSSVVTVNFTLLMLFGFISAFVTL